MFNFILLCLLSCFSSFMPLKQSESIISEDHIQVVEKKTKQNYVKTSSGYYEFGYADLSSTFFLESLAPYLADNYNEPRLNYNSNEAISNFVITTSNVYQVFYYNTGDMSYSSAFNVSNIVISKRIINNSTPDWPVFAYDFTFANSSPYDKQVTITWLAQRTLSMRGLTIWGVNLDISSALLTQFSNTKDWWYQRLMLSEKIGGFGAFIGNIFTSIQGDPYNTGYNVGYNDGLSIGYNIGEEDGYQSGYTAGQLAGYTTGYNTGVSDTIASGSEAMTIFAGIMDVAFIPVNVFFLMFNYEVFGINIAGFVSGLLTIAIVIILLRFIFGRKV